MMAGFLHIFLLSIYSNMPGVNTLTTCCPGCLILFLGVSALFVVSLLRGIPFILMIPIMIPAFVGAPSSEVPSATSSAATTPSSTEKWWWSSVITITHVSSWGTVCPPKVRPPPPEGGSWRVGSLLPLYHILLVSRWTAPWGTSPVVSPIISPTAEVWSATGRRGTLVYFFTLHSFFIVLSSWPWWSTSTWVVLSEPTTIGSVLATLNTGSIRSRYIGCLVTLFPLDDIKLHLLSVPDTTKVFPRIILGYGRLMYKYVLLGVITVDKSITALHVEPFHSACDL
uniref:Uncharacterized protein n=1 Tax=Pinctada fucata TaxID=50426 RepID=A0A194AKM4_PINFU